MNTVNPEQKVEVVGEISEPGNESVPEKNFAKIVVREDFEAKKDAKIPTCCVCKELPYDPQSLSCGHSLCIVCCETMLLKTPGSIKCPLCTKITESYAVIPNYALREILQLCWEDEYKSRKILDFEQREERKSLIKLNKVVSHRGINVTVGRDTNPQLLLKIIMCLEKNPDKTKYPVGLDVLLEDKKSLYIANYVTNPSTLLSKDFYYCIFSMYKGYVLCVF